MNDVKTSAMSKESAGNFFEDFKLGQEIVHATPRTVTVGDTSLFTALYGSRFAVQSSDAFAQAIGYPTAPIDDLLLYDWAEPSGMEGTATSNAVAGSLADAIDARLAELDSGVLDLHFIGHGRGAYVNAEVLRRLAVSANADRIGFVQMTTLDPLLLAALVLQACAVVPPVEENESRSEFRSASMTYVPPPPLAGAVYNTGSFDLFMDLRARAIGDILTIMLVERTNASKESSTSTAKGSSVDTGFPVIAGRPVTANGTPILNNEFESETTFDGQADSSQSNRLDGSITVTVAAPLWAMSPTARPFFARDRTAQMPCLDRRR